ncbi:MAG TPA: hypothetical protein VH186_02545 [Chloroflexia bacterium]|nr:hypothetical protein [Chloroflexia bacterium]
MPTEENKVLVRRFWDEFNKGNFDGMLKMITKRSNWLPARFNRAWQTL